jgi:hypothetical protein
VTTVQIAEGIVLERVLDTAWAASNDGLSRQAFGRFEAAQCRTRWGRSHQRRLALIDGAHVLASAKQYDLPAVIDGRPVRVCALGTILPDDAQGSVEHVHMLIESVIAGASRDGAELALLFSPFDVSAGERNGFHVLPTTDFELRVVESTRRGAPMALIRGGEERDLAAIAAMGQVRAVPFRFHLDRDADFVQFAIVRQRLLAGLGRAGAHELQFFIAEEGITAAAYVVLNASRRTWTITECGDRDVSGARVGAILQALIAREPTERRPLIRGWLPPGFVPPQARLVSSTPSSDAIMVRSLGSAAVPPGVSAADVLYWLGDVF